MTSGPTNIQLDSISFFLEDEPLLKGKPLGSHLMLNLGKYQWREFKTLDYSKALAHWPPIFTKPLKAYAEPELSELAVLTRLGHSVRYNFGDGVQVAASEILRTPYQASVPEELLPRVQSSPEVFMSWPLLDGIPTSLHTDSVEQVFQIIQPLMARIVQWQQKKKIELYLQSTQKPRWALQLKSIEFDSNQEFFWRVELTERPQLQAEFCLKGIHKSKVYFFNSMALDPEQAVLIVHPWKSELERIQEEVRSFSQWQGFYDRELPKFNLAGEFEIRTIIKFLRKRSIGLQWTGETKTLTSDKSLTELHLQHDGYFYIQHLGQRPHGESISRRGFSLNSQVLLQTLSEGIGFRLRADPKDIASRDAKKRIWDLKLLRHQGITQFLTFAVLKCYFEKDLAEFQDNPEKLFLHFQPVVKKILLDKASFAAFGHLELVDLCSKPVLKIFENYISSIFGNLKMSETFYSEQGELVLEGLVEREHRLIFELLKNRFFVGGANYFEKAKTDFAKNTSNFESWQDMNAEVIEFCFSKSSQGPSESIAWTLEVSHNLKLFNFQLFYDEKPVQEVPEQGLEFDFALTSSQSTKNINWFELDPTVFLNGSPVDLGEIFKLQKGQRLIEHNGKSYLLPKSQMPLLNYLEIFWLQLQKSELSGESSTKKGKRKEVYQIQRHQTLELLSLREKGVALRGDHAWLELCQFYDNLGTAVHSWTPPEGLKAELKKFQMQGAQWLYDLYRLKLGALLADEMGLGKTLQTLSFLQRLKKEDRLQKNLIVVPSSLIFNWQSEAKKFTPDLPMTIFTSRDLLRIGRLLESAGDVTLLISYGLLVEKQDFLSQYNWNVVIFDEAQNLKNISTRRAKAARQLKANFKMALTGTPMENHYAEFYSIIDLILPGALGRLDDFRRKFVNTDLITREEMNQLRLRLKPIILRRTKAQTSLELPEKQETKVLLAFDDEQLQIYRDVAISYNEQVKDMMALNSGKTGEVQLRMLTALLRLRQVCSDPTGLPNVNYSKTPPKIKTLLSSLKEIQASGRSALVFTQFLQTMKSIEVHLRQQGLEVLVLHGGQSSTQRKRILEKFENSSEPQILLMTIKTGGVGLNLTKASYVFHLEPWWNPAVENQATDRAHRMGQKNPVQVIRYVMHNSLEEKIEQLKERKSEKFFALFGQNMTEDSQSPSHQEAIPRLDHFANSLSLSKSDFSLLLGLAAES